jgi:signal transduction histidine kinase
MTELRRWREYNRIMLSRSVVRVRIPPLMDATTYISLVVMSLLAVRGLHTLQSQLIALTLCAAFGLLYRFVFRTGLYEKSPVVYFGSQLVVLILLLMLRTTSVDAINFLFLIVSIHAALVLGRDAGILWIAAYYLTVCSAVFLTRGTNGYYAAAFYLVAYVVCGFFGYILQQAELARARNQQLVEELQSTQHKLRDLAVMEERNRLARDLHDSVKQQVFAISMQLSAARTSLQETDTAYPSVLQAEKLAQQAGAELTTLIHQLRPPGLGRKSLPEAVRDYVHEWTRQNNIATELDIGEVSVSVECEQALFRVLQEALANVARHSQANKAWVTLQPKDDGVTLIVRDNGIGYDTERIARGIGLDSMNERLAAVSGTLDVYSLAARGTTVTAIVRRSA